MLKLSKYNFYFETKDGEIGIFNTITKSVASFPAPWFEIAENGRILHVKLTKNDDQYPETMYSYGFVLDEGIDEKTFIRNQFNTRVLCFDPGYLALSIIPTFRCNLSCKYCYEAGGLDNNRLDMGDDVLHSVLSFISGLNGSVKKLQVNFYGGEPLLDKNRFTGILREICDLCKKNDISLGLGLITNGYNFDKDIADFLSELNLECFIQITLDGSRELHDTKRVLKNGHGTFDRIMTNLKYLLSVNNKRNFMVNIRVNIGENEASSFHELCTFLKKEEIFDQINLYAAPIFDESSMPCNDMETPFGFDQQTYELNNHVAKLKGNEVGKAFQVLHGSHELCVLLMRNAFMIDPNGDLYKCYMDITDKNRRIGNISEMFKLRSNANYVEMMNRTKLDVPMCSDCPALPLCITYCPRDTIVKNICHNYPEMIKREIGAYLQQKPQFAGIPVKLLGFAGDKV